MDLFKCHRCNIEKSLIEDFPVARNSSFGFEKVCKECRNKAYRDRRKRLNKRRSGYELGTEDRREFWDINGNGLYC